MEHTETKKRQYESLRSALKLERESFIAHWKAIADAILPRRAKFQLTDTNRGDRRNQKIVDSTATLAQRTLRGGMMSGITSPARPWFRLNIADANLMESQNVKAWLSVVTQRMSDVFTKSNLYNILPILYGDLGVFGTAPIVVEKDIENIIRCQSIPIGSYMIAVDGQQRVRTFVREFRLTVRQLIGKFGNRDKNGKLEWSNFSKHAKEMYERKNMDTWIDVVHIIMENEDYNPSSLRSKKFLSVYYEMSGGGASRSGDESYTGGMDDEDLFLRESGFDYFPVLCPRWEVTGEDVYGTDCPGIMALGDVNALQLMVKRNAQIIEKKAKPPMVGPSFMKTQKVSTLAGDMTYADEREGQKGFRAAYDVNMSTVEINLAINEHQRRIDRCFFVDLILMMAQTDRREITAREIDERHEEKLLVLGPVLEQLNQDLLDPLIDITFKIMLEHGGLIPDPPEELSGMDLKIEYISIMAQAQKMLGIANVERFLGFVGNAINTFQDPSIKDKIDIDQAIDIYGDMTSVPPGIVRPDEIVAQIRAQAQADKQRQMQSAMMAQGAQTAKTLSGANLEGQNALTAMMAQKEEAAA